MVSQRLGISKRFQNRILFNQSSIQGRRVLSPGFLLGFNLLRFGSLAVDPPGGQVLEYNLGRFCLSSSTLLHTYHAQDPETKDGTVLTSPLITTDWFVGISADALYAIC